MTDIEVSRRLTASRERVWHALSDPAEFVAWFWPPRLQAIGDLDARVGGVWRIASEVAGFGVSGVFTAVDEPTLLAFTWRWDGDPEETLVTVTIDDDDDDDDDGDDDGDDDDGDGTLLTVAHEGFATVEDADSHVEGWSDCLDRLVASL